MTLSRNSPVSVIFMDPAESPLEVMAGTRGLEALIVQYPRDDA